MPMNCTSGRSCGSCRLTNVDKGAIIKASERIVQLSCGGGVGDALSMVFVMMVVRWVGWPVGRYLNLLVDMS